MNKQFQSLLCLKEKNVGQQSCQLTIGGVVSLSFDMRHEKTDLKVFVVVIPKEGLAGRGSANPSLGMTLTIKYYSPSGAHYSVVIVIPKEGLAGPSLPILLWV